MDPLYCNGSLLAWLPKWQFSIVFSPRGSGKMTPLSFVHPGSRIHYQCADTARPSRRSLLEEKQWADFRKRMSPPRQQSGEANDAGARPFWVMGTARSALKPVLAWSFTG